MAQSADKTIGAQRKKDHIRICRDEDVEATFRDRAWQRIKLTTCALPTFDWNEIDTSTEWLGKRFSLPLLITGMTGGVEKGAEINLRLARAASELDIPMGVGSQRIAIEDPSLSSIFSVKHQVPGVFLIGNIGLSQILHERAYDDCLRAIEMIEADAFAVHLNILQELIQPEGDRVFRGALEKIQELASRLPVPLMVKEVGAGLDVKSATALAEAGVRSLDVGGSGGTSWGYIEGLRADEETKTVSEVFRDWGIPTIEAVKDIVDANIGCDIVATGGVRDGLMAAKALAVGSTMVGIGLPFFKAALQNDEEVIALAKRFERELKIAMMCSGSKTLIALRGKAQWML